MLTESDLQRFIPSWKDVSVIEAPWDMYSVLVILIFDQKSTGKDFLGLLSQNDFGVSAFNYNDTYKFEIGFPTYEIGIDRTTDIPVGHYKLLDWYKERRSFFVTAGVWVNSNPEMRLSDYGGNINLPIKNMFYEDGL